MAAISPNFYKTILDNLYDGVYFVDRNRKITYWNKGAERITGFTDAEVIGTHCWDNILQHINDDGINLCETECPLAKTIKDGRAREAEVYLHHKKGHRLPVSVRIAPIRDTKRKIIGGVEVFTDLSAKLEERDKIKELQKMALFDPLTGIGNRRYLEINLSSRLSELKRYGWSFGVMFLDIDHFKKINDTYGHFAGDEVLKMVAKTVSHNLRSFDIIGRWGGDEFLALVVNIDDMNLSLIANKVRVLTENSSLTYGQDNIQVTLSIGATLGKRGDTVNTLLKRADRLLYKSKVTGHNKVTMKV